MLENAPVVMLTSTVVVSVSLPAHAITAVNPVIWPGSAPRLLKAIVPRDLADLWVNATTASRLDISLETALTLLLMVNVVLVVVAIVVVSVVVSAAPTATAAVSPATWPETAPPPVTLSPAASVKTVEVTAEEAALSAIASADPLAYATSATNPVIWPGIAETRSNGELATDANANLR